MQPPGATQAGQQARAGETLPAVSLRLPEPLRKRADFLKANHARRRSTAAFTLQARQREAGEADPQIIRVGFTCSRKVGNAVIRNRAKRRLREIARHLLPIEGHPGWDYVLIGRPGSTVSHPFDQMLADLHTALVQIHKNKTR